MINRIIISNTELHLWLGADPKPSICSTLSILAVELIKKKNWWKQESNQQGASENYQISSI